MSPLDSFERSSGDVVTFGSGHLHGQLYYRLSKMGLVVSGGAECVVVGSRGGRQRGQFQGPDR